MAARSVQEIAPARPLRATVDGFWLAPPSGGARPFDRTVLPDGCMDLIFRFEREPGRAGTLLVSGPDRRARRVLVDPGTGFVGVRFQPGQARRLLGLDPAALIDAGAVPAALSAELARIERRLGGCRSLADLLSALDAEVAHLAERTLRLAPPPRVSAAIGLLRAARAGPCVASVARAVGVTPRTLRRELVAWTGLAPKALARIFRFQATVSRLRERPCSLADLAAEMGYADQAHMARECRALGDARPGNLLRR